MVLPFFFLATFDSAIAGLEEAKNLAGKVLRLIQIGWRCRDLKKSSCLSSKLAPRESPIPVPQKRSTFHPRAQSSVGRRGVRQQSRSFAPRNQWLTRNPSSN